MKIFLYFLAAIAVASCAATTLSYSACLGFCVKMEVDKEETPEHVSKAMGTVTSEKLSKPSKLETLRNSPSKRDTIEVQSETITEVIAPNPSKEK